jgi:hypothetical protein
VRVTSPSAALAPEDGGWNSLDDQGADDGAWQESNPTPERISELNPISATVPTSGTRFELGRLVNTANGRRDLTFGSLLADRTTAMQGIVRYASVTPNADLNGDGAVDRDDLFLWQANFGTEVGATRATGDTNADGDADGADFLTWQAQFASGGPRLTHRAVPEPTSVSLLMTAVVGCLAGLRLGSGREDAV